MYFSSRKGKLYLVSTTTSTSTLSTTSICWIQFSTVNGIITCAKKKRSIAFLEEIAPQPAAGDIQPHPALKNAEEHEENPFAVIHEEADVTASKNDDEDYEDREARYLNYWMTRTVTTTYTTFTATSSIGSVYCTPLGYTELPCPANG